MASIMYLHFSAMGNQRSFQIQPETVIWLNRIYIGGLLFQHLKLIFLIFRVRSARINSMIRCAQCFTCLFDIVQLNFLPRVFCLGDLP